LMITSVIQQINILKLTKVHYPHMNKIFCVLGYLTTSLALAAKTPIDMDELNRVI
jgi:hypothetical protein